MRLALAVALCTIPLTLASQAPPARAHHSLVNSPAHGGILLTAGSTPHDGGQRCEFFNDLWLLDARGWRRLGTVGSMMSGVALAFDTRRQRLYSLGGYDGQTSLADFRVLEAGAWRVLAPFPGGPAAEPGLVYDAARDRLVAFGGSAAAGGAAGETWEYDGTTWSKKDIASPPGRQAHVLVYDAARKRVVLYGGMGAGAPGRPGPQLADTWEYDGTRWNLRATTGPGPRLGAGATYDSKRGLLLLFGGAGPSGFLGDTWTWDGTTWRQVATTGPAPRVMGYLAYDPARDRTILFGGRTGWPDGDRNDTWEWDGAAWRPGQPAE
ncbi:MAG: hypothetical protein IPK12_21340 [Gemmatimonadetes bacterium]|nr:hypothetical protein [Gemmatimonadota bacterium]